MFETMTSTRRPGALAAAILGALTLAAAGLGAADEAFVTVDRFVPHTSTVPANAGERVGLFLHEKLSRDLADRIAAGERPDGRVVLFVHGGSIPSVPDYDLPYKDYSWMEHLAAAGFDTFSMDQTGYGLSPRPMMDDPCNMAAENRAIVTPNPLAGDCHPSYRHGLTTSQSDWDEIGSVVDYIRALRGVDKVSLVGWSAGGPRTGGFAARHPDKIDKLVLFAPGYRRQGPSDPPARFGRRSSRCASRRGTPWRTGAGVPPSPATARSTRAFRGSSGRRSWPTTSAARSGVRRTA